MSLGAMLGMGIAWCVTIVSLLIAQGNRLLGVLVFLTFYALVFAYGFHAGYLQ